LRKRANTTATLLCQDRLQHCKHLLGCLSSGLVTYEVGQFVTASFNRAHVAAQVVHQDFRRVGATLQHCLGVIALVIALVIIFGHGVHEALHDADVFDVVALFHHSFVHVDSLKKTNASTFCTCSCGEGS
jgi:hypothetical protein